MVKAGKLQGELLGAQKPVGTGGFLIICHTKCVDSVNNMGDDIRKKKKTAGRGRDSPLMQEAIRG